MPTNEISEFFDVEPHQMQETTPMDEMEPIIHADGVKLNAQDDYHQARESMKHLITKGTQMIDKMAKVADESESPRAFEVMGGYLKQIADMNKLLLEMNKDAKDILEVKEDSEGQTNNNFVYVGSTEELQKYLDNKE